MLGCHDFCGYYDWSFHYVRRRWGLAGVELLWHKAIGGDSQQHYSDPAAGTGLKALYHTWVKTGQDEHCDWTFTLDEEKNVLRWDMRECPSKGFLVKNDLNADEDYCNHCMGWIIPMLEGVGAEILEHEHNHCGQCWATMRMKDRDCPDFRASDNRTAPLDPFSGNETFPPAAKDVDIRNDPRWRRGYLDRWANNQPQPHQSEIGPSSDPSEMLEAWFRGVDVLSRIAADSIYDDRQQCPAEPLAVLIGCPPADLAATAARYHATPPSNRPLLLHAFLPGVAFADFPAAGLPRPVPILPLLIRKGKYTHNPGGPYPTTEEFLALLAAAVGR
jgi:hypothetical protein